MHKIVSRYLAFLLLFNLFLPSCQEVPDMVPETGVKDGAWTKVHYRATVSGSEETKATLDAIDRHYLFERDDLMYVVDSETGGDKLYGYLYLISGAGATEAVFEGDLMYFVKKSSNPDVYEPERPADNLAVTGTLVSKVQRDNSVYTINASNEGKIASGPDFGNHYADTFKEAVQKYSTFTAGATYGNPSFSLVQGTAFLLFSLSFEDTVSSSLTISLKNNVGGSGETTLFSKSSVQPDVNHEASFVAAFPGGTITLSNAKLIVSDGGSFNHTKSLASASLQSNRYYSIDKAFLDLTYFTIQAGATATSITFNYSTIDYSTDNGSTWTSAGSVPTVTLVADQSMKVRGSGTSYDYDTASQTIFTSTENCYIYGDMMSLFSHATTLGTAALRGAFKDMANIDIHPARPLILSAQTLSQSCYKQMFSGSGITRAPEFYNEEGDFAADIPSNACDQMFKDCTALTAAPELPANGTIATEGYKGMFSGCTAMTTPPSHLAVTPASGSHSNFKEMFQGCTALLLSPELSASEVKNYGCQSMFDGCTSLTESPDLPAQTVGEYAYNCMFQNCSSLGQGPSALPATVMKKYCYASMFKNCALLGAVPRIDAVSLAQYCFSGMFYECGALRTIQSAFSFSGDIPQYACYQMFYNCVVLNRAPEMTSVTGTIESNGCKEMYRGCGEMRTAPSSLNATAIGQDGYNLMFYTCVRLLDAPSIAATSVGKRGCQQMFSGCTRLQRPPASLPATTLGEQAYYQMFFGCSALASIPSFPTTDITWQGKEICYQMFQNCTSLTTLTEPLFSGASTLGVACFQDMFSHCTALANIPDGLLPATTLAQDCYRGMFQYTNLTRAPFLLVEVLSWNDCYRYMFYACKKLAYIKCLAKNPYPDNKYTQNFTGGGVASSGTFVKNPNMTNNWTTGANGIPSGWTVEDNTP